MDDALSQGFICDSNLLETLSQLLTIHERLVVYDAFVAECLIPQVWDGSTIE